MIGSHGLVASLKQHGFDMFEDLVDISYDSMPNDQRLPAAIDLNKNLIQGKIDLASYSQRLRAQREFLINDYAKQLEAHFVKDCEQLINKLNLQ